MSDLQPIQTAIESGDKRGARQLLKPLLEAEPTADLWMLASTACENPEQEFGCVRQALKLDSRHTAARQRYKELREVVQLSTQEMPSLETLTSDLLNLPPLEALAPLTPPPPDIFALKREKQKAARQRWNRIGCIGSVLMSLSLSYFVLTVTGSPIPAQIRQILSGESPSGKAAGTPIFGRPNPTAQPTTLSERVNATSIPAIMTLSPTHDASDVVYSDEAQAAGFVVSPNKSAPLTKGSPISDILDPGFAHEYIITVTTGAEVDVAIQFLSPTAKNVGANVAIIDPDGYNAEAHCQRDTILKDGSSIAFICQAHKGGNWKVQLFGRAGESTGVYVISYDTM